jgi:two-component system, cell cycle sensor histidine kinase and response regulator CckA
VIAGQKQARTALEHAEVQLRHVQKMEAIGRLAGGIAHDFNNLLSVILGYTSLLLRRLPDQDPSKTYIAEIDAAGRRAADLTRQLLAFGRKQKLNPRVLDMNEVISDMERMLLRVLGEDVRLTARKDADLGRVRVDRGQIEHVLMNLAVNARDAMPAGGEIVLETRNVDVSTGSPPFERGVAAGRYVVLSVSDTGSGMDEATLARVFEPFFTTKEVGKGTGLGLSMVLGIVEQSGGHVLVDSRLGKGTVFSVYLPRSDAPAEATEIAALDAPRGGTELVLLVEDEPEVRALGRALLEDGGYRVLDAGSPSEALRLARDHDGIDALVTDIVMPEMNGREVARAVREMLPRVKVIYASGYSGRTSESELSEDGALFVEKPLTRAKLLTAVRAALDEPGSRT